MLRQEGQNRPAAVCPPEITDGYLVHAAALRAGLKTSLFAGQTLLVTDPLRAEATSSFAHGVPEQTELGGATMIHDKRIRRAMLQPFGISMPRSASFSVGRGTRKAAEFAANLGFPVVVKPAVGEPTIETQANIRNERQLIEAIDYLKTAPAYRPGFTSASYAFTALYAPKEDTEQETRDSYRFLVEEQLSGVYLRLLIVGGNVVSALELPKGPWRARSEVDEVLKEVDPSILDLANCVWNALPGLSVATIDIILERGHQRAISEQDYWVVEVSERPWLHLHLDLAPGSADRMAAEILMLGTGENSIRGWDTDTVRSVSWEGVSEPARLLEQFGSLALDLGVEGWMKVVDSVGGLVQGHMQGNANSIALLNEFVVGGMLDERAIVADLQLAQPLELHPEFQV